MGMSWAYGTPDDAESIATIHEAIDLGVTFLDTAEVYGPSTNEELLGRALAGVRSGRDRHQVRLRLLARGPGDRARQQPGARESACEASLRRLGTDHIDLLYQHRVDPDVPIEETVGAMAELVRAGKVRDLGLSEVGPPTLRRGQDVHPISALQTEYSLWEREVEAEMLPGVPRARDRIRRVQPARPRAHHRARESGPRSTAGRQPPEHPRFQGENYDPNMSAWRR